MSIYEKSLIKAFKKCNIKQGDTVLVHSDILKLGLFEKTIRETLNTYYNSIKKVVGEKDGTIAVPAFFYEYSRFKKPFDIKKSPVSKELGIFSAYVNELKSSKRSINPISSIAAVGKNSKFICEGQTGSAFGVDSAWDRLQKLKAKMLFVGVDTSVMTYPHYVEHMIGVPHIYNKYFKTPVYKNGKKIQFPISAQLRYLDYDIKYRNNYNQLFEKNGLIIKTKLNKGYISSVKFEDMFTFLQKKIQKDFFFYLKNKPKFNKNKVPIK